MRAVPAPERDLDPHREAVYDWEDSWPAWNTNTSGLQACRATIQRACKAYSVKPPKVTSHNVRSLSYYATTRLLISLQGRDPAGTDKGGLNIPTACHEAAHHIVWLRYGEKVQDHGPTFLGIYIDLLFRNGVAPLVALEASAKSFGLTWR